MAILLGKVASKSHTDLMKRRVESLTGRPLYGRCLAIVEPVSGTLRHNKKLNRFILRGRAKVDVQWKLFCLAHSLDKLTHNGYAQ